MVSLIRKFSCVFFMSALVLVCLLMPAELKAGVPCCKNGKISTCPNPGNGQSYDLSGCQGGISPVDPVVPVNPGLEIEIGGEVFLGECTSGQAQYKPSGDCGTSKRTCCSGGTWSEWDGECFKCMGNRPSGSCGPGNCGEVVGECNEILGTWVTKCNMDKCPKWYQIYKASRKAFTLSGSCDSIAGANQKCKEAADGENGYCPNGTASGQVCFPEGSSCILGARNYSLQTTSSTPTIKSCECWIHYAGELQCRK